MTKNSFFLLLLCVLIGPLTYAQSEYNPLGGDRPAWLDKVYVGGGIGGISFSSNQTYVNLSVMAGYRFTERLNSGVAVNYIYQDYDDGFIEFTRKGLGWNFFTQYTVYEPFFLMARYDIYTIWQDDFKTNLDALLFGGGVNQSIGGKGFMSLYALYNVLHSIDPVENLYASPWVIGANIGLGF
ncbi:MAG: hypothetical protein ABJF11_00720 [Reichenbachiella sp.]|uniref:hypothetical protein n=1 Tax=Reichenbachiella sp. TaxID=2184521 RepID=UPI003264455B